MSEHTKPETLGGCPYCSSGSQQIFHGGKCPKVRSIEYQPDGVTPKKVEFFPNAQTPFYDALGTSVL